jgi:hypothetical protein
MITVSFSKEEVAALLGLMDAGVKALGRPAAKACAVLDEKIAAAINASKVTPLKSVPDEAIGN